MRCFSKKNEKKKTKHLPLWRFVCLSNISIASSIWNGKRNGEDEKKRSLNRFHFLQMECVSHYTTKNEFQTHQIVEKIKKIKRRRPERANMNESTALIKLKWMRRYDATQSHENDDKNWIAYIWNSDGMWNMANPKLNSDDSTEQRSTHDEWFYCTTH